MTRKHGWREADALAPIPQSQKAPSGGAPAEDVASSDGRRSRPQPLSPYFTL
jgi:hypothetical protein